MFFFLFLYNNEQNDNRKAILSHIGHFFENKVDFKVSISYLTNFMLLFGNDYGVNMDTIEMAYNLVLAIIIQQKKFFIQQIKLIGNAGQENMKQLK